jgi:hypothetical protein
MACLGWGVIRRKCSGSWQSTRRLLRRRISTRVQWGLGLMRLDELTRADWVTERDDLFCQSVVLALSSAIPDNQAFHGVLTAWRLVQVARQLACFG